jgi:transposase
MSYDKKYRKRTIEYLNAGHTYRETAGIFGISTNTLAKWVKMLKKTGVLTDPPPKRVPRKIRPLELQAYLKAHPDAYQSEIAAHFHCTQASVSRYLRKAGYTRKKRQSATRSRIREKSKSTFAK